MKAGPGFSTLSSVKGVMTIDGQEVEVRAGNMILIDKGESRGIRAIETMMAFGVHTN
jgi:quercetin dioxygenase-like cupin family protein